MLFSTPNNVFNNFRRRLQPLWLRRFLRLPVLDVAVSAPIEPEAVREDELTTIIYIINKGWLGGN